MTFPSATTACHNNLWWIWRDSSSFVCSQYRFCKAYKLIKNYERVRPRLKRGTALRSSNSTIGLQLPDVDLGINSDAGSDIDKDAEEESSGSDDWRLTLRNDVAPASLLM